MATIGTLIDGKYEILKMIGKGGMSKVYLAMDQNLNKQWAVKEIVKEGRNKNNEVIIQSALAEANMMKRLDHPCLPRIVDIIERVDVIYVVMDYIEGEPLNKILEKSGPQPQELVIEWAKDLCDVLDYLHSQNPPIIYRDMKPANIMLQPNGTIKLIDFGIAREYKEHNIQDTVSLGTKGYAAPEQFGGKGQTDRRTDIYGLGVTLYHLVTGKNPCEPPYEIYPIRYWDARLSAGLESIVVKCTQLNPDDRYDSCAELFYALEHYEMADLAYRGKQKRKVGLFATMVALSFISLIVGITGQILKNHKIDQDYNQFVARAEKETVEDDSIALYQEAIALDKTRTEAYLGLLNTFKRDNCFSVEETKIFSKALSADYLKLKDQEDYGKLAYEVGKTYWYYYKYNEVNDNSTAAEERIKEATKWFDDACTFGEDEEYYNLAKTYSLIGDFHSNIVNSLQEASDGGMYIQYFEELEEMVKLVDDETSEIIILQVDNLCINAINDYRYKFKKDGVSRKRMEKLLSKTIVQAGSVETSSDTSEDLKKLIVSKESVTNESIKRTFEGEEEE